MMKLELRKILLLAALSFSVLSLGACSIPERGPGVPAADTTRALPLGIANARFFADGDPKAMIDEGTRAFEREQAMLRAEGKPATRLPPVYFLAVSGGGDNGAFGAGLMNGWTALGTRPEFKMVTGVSTGALIAPFAFLGPAYDDALRDVYTNMTPDKVFKARGLAAALFNDAMADTGPLSEVIAGYANQAMLDAIAREYQKGRLLLIGTTYLDAQRPTIWNIGAIAASGHPGSLELFRKILRASAAIPGLFQPVLIDVEIDSRKYQEMHVIRNARLDPDYAESERRTISIAGRAINTMLAASGQNDVLRTYFISQRDGVDYNLAYIGADFSAPKAGEFDQTYMRALYAYGFQEGRDGKAWHKLPPGLQAGGVSAR
jgi:predicted acylesterase/phospholipase RssA